MAAGHDHPDWVSADTAKLKRFMEDPAVQQYRWSHFSLTNQDHDLPYLAGYSKDGNTIYFDRHLPEQIDIIVDGRKWTIDPRDFVRIHEQTEKTLIDVRNLRYGPAHSLANAAERRAVLARGIPWIPYNEALDPFIKADEIERLKSVPADLDMRPYNFPPVNRLLIKRMYAAMGQKKLKKTDPTVEYSDDRGRPNRHCGPDQDWPKGWCAHYDSQYTCAVVQGYISPKGGCKLFRRASSRADT